MTLALLAEILKLWKIKKLSSYISEGDLTHYAMLLALSQNPTGLRSNLDEISHKLG